MNDTLRAIDIVWIASYPRSGNTFLRILLCYILFGRNGAHNLDRDMPEYVHPDHFPSETARHVSSRKNDLIISKTHFWKMPEFEQFEAMNAIYLYRHPMDVFLSGMNYLYINSDKFISFRRYFIDQNPMSVEDISKAGQLDYYLDFFLKDDGFAPFTSFAGGWYQSMVAWHKASSGRVQCINYERLIADTQGIVTDLLNRLSIEFDPADIEVGISRALSHTRPDGKFYWKGRPNVYRDFLRQDQVDRYFAVYGPGLEKLGVQFSSM